MGRFTCVTVPMPLDDFDPSDTRIEPSVPRRFDLVFFDQRGLALSGGLTCPQVAATYYRTDSQTRTPAQERASPPPPAASARTADRGQPPRPAALPGHRAGGRGPGVV